MPVCNMLISDQYINFVSTRLLILAQITVIGDFLVFVSFLVISLCCFLGQDTALLSRCLRQQTSTNSMGSGDQCAHSRVYGLLQSAKQTKQTHTFNQNKLLLHIKQPSPQSSHAVVGINSKALVLQAITLDFKYTTLLIT